MPSAGPTFDLLVLRSVRQSFPRSTPHALASVAARVAGSQPLTPDRGPVPHISLVPPPPLAVSRLDPGDSTTRPTSAARRADTSGSGRGGALLRSSFARPPAETTTPTMRCAAHQDHNSQNASRSQPGLLPASPASYSPCVSLGYNRRKVPCRRPSSSLGHAGNCSPGGPLSSRGGDEWRV